MVKIKGRRKFSLVNELLHDNGFTMRFI